jgi:hypothetical protein
MDAILYCTICTVAILYHATHATTVFYKLKLLLRATLIQTRRIKIAVLL